jgi:hypothetical protein
MPNGRIRTPSQQQGRVPWSPRRGDSTGGAEDAPPRSFPGTQAVVVFQAVPRRGAEPPLQGVRGLMAAVSGRRPPPRRWPIHSRVRAQTIASTCRSFSDLGQPRGLDGSQGPVKPWGASCRRGCEMRPADRRRGDGDGRRNPKRCVHILGGMMRLRRAHPAPKDAIVRSLDSSARRRVRLAEIHRGTVWRRSKALFVQPERQAASTPMAARSRSHGVVRQFRRSTSRTGPTAGGTRLLPAISSTYGTTEREQVFAEATGRTRSWSHSWTVADTTPRDAWSSSEILAWTATRSRRECEVLDGGGARRVPGR